MKEMVVPGKTMVTERMTSYERMTKSMGGRSMESTHLMTGHGFRRGRPRGSKGCCCKPIKNTVYFHAQSAGRPSGTWPGYSNSKNLVGRWNDQSGATFSLRAIRSFRLLFLYKTGGESFLFHFAESFRTRYSFQSVPAPGSSRLFPEHAPQWSALPSDLGQDSSEAIATLLVFIDDLFAQP